MQNKGKNEVHLSSSRIPHAAHNLCFNIRAFLRAMLHGSLRGVSRILPSHRTRRKYTLEWHNTEGVDATGGTQDTPVRSFIQSCPGQPHRVATIYELIRRDARVIPPPPRLVHTLLLSFPADATSACTRRERLHLEIYFRGILNNLVIVHV